MSSPELPIFIALAPDITPDEYLIKADITMIGRSDMCQIIVPRKTISRIHAAIERDGPRHLIRDANSANGTYVNGRRILEPHRLKDQDLIGLSSPEALLRFEDLDSTVELPGLLHYDEQMMTFLLNQEPATLTPTQFRLLHHLYQHAGTVCTRESCAQAIWNRPYNPDLDTDALDRTVSNLRRQLRKIDPAADLIQTRRGLGYVLVL